MAKHIVQEEMTLDEMAARNLLRLVREHRENCPGESCSVTLGILLPTFMRLIDGTPSPDELRAFL